jgi:hypothetical protein
MATDMPPHESWTKPVHAYFVRNGGAWKLIGFERLPHDRGRTSVLRMTPV